MIFIKKLPKIYQNTIDKNINNNKKTYYIRNKTSEESLVSETMTQDQIDSVLDGSSKNPKLLTIIRICYGFNINLNEFFDDDIFNDIGYSFNIPVIIKTNTKTYETSLITRTNGYLLTFDNHKIRIDEIVYIQRKNP